MSSSKKSNNTKNSSKSKAKTNNKNQDKKVFTTKTSYQEAVSKENAKIHNSENRIEELKKMLSNLDTTKKSKVESKKVNTKPKKVNGISTSQKHTVMSVSEVEKYNYKVRLSTWRKNAGYNEKPHTCSKCKEQCYTSILLDNGSHICYFCWIRKPKSTVTKSNIKTPIAKKEASNNQKKKK